MTVKEYLQQLYYIDKEIASLSAEIADLRDKATRITRAPSGERVQTFTRHDGQQRTITRIVELEEKIRERIDCYIRLKYEIHDKISKLERDDYRLILCERYINFKKWEQIAVDLGYSYRQTLRIHGKALSSLKRENPALFGGVVAAQLVKRNA